MLVIRPAQTEALLRSRRSAFVAELGAHVGHFFPDDARVLAGEPLDAVLELGIDRAALHGIGVTGQVAHYVSIMFMLGSFFDEDPQLPWAAAALRGAEADPGVRLEGLHRNVIDHLRAVSGPQGGVFRRALAQARSACFSAYDAGSLTDRAVRALAERLHPAKVPCIADFAAVAALAREKAAVHGLPLAGEGTLCGPALMLLAGAHFDRDPIHPWAAGVLALDVAPQAKARVLHREALARLDRYFLPRLH